MLAYEFTGFTYIPVSLNILSGKKKFHLLNGNYLSCEFSSKLFDLIYSCDSGTFVIDLKEINLGDSRCFVIFNEILRDKKNTQIIFVNFNEIIKEFLTNDCFEYLKHDVTHDIISCEKGIEVFRNKIQTKQSLQDEIRIFISKKIKDNIFEKEQHLKSSNVFVNKYIDVKRIFLFPSVYYLILFELALLIDRKFEDFSKLICCSYNGAAIATILGQLLNKEVIYLMNLGPSISFNNVDMVSQIENNKKYLFVSDMMCLGTEYNVTKTIVKLKKAYLIGAASIIKYLSPEYANCDTSLVEIKDGDTFGYKVFVKKLG